MTRLDVAQQRRKTTAIACVKKLDAAASALRAFLHACNECSDDSASLSLQGKGVDGRETLIRDLTEYAGYLESKYGSWA
jgi:hypothetical protein